MFEILAVTVVLSLILAYKFRSAALSAVPAFFGFLVALYLGRPIEALLIVLSSCIPFSAEAYEAKDFLKAAILATMLAWFYAFIARFAIANTLFLAFLVGTLIYATLESSLFLYSIVLLVIIAIVDVPREHELEASLIVLALAGLFLPGISSVDKAYYAGELEKPITVNLGALHHRWWNIAQRQADRAGGGSEIIPKNTRPDSLKALRGAFGVRARGTF